MTAFDIAQLPTRTLPVGTTLHRVHEAQNSPWYFSASDLGRFNPTHAPGRGACYWAEDPLGAWIESFRTMMVLSPASLDAKAISRIVLRSPAKCVDLADRRCLAAGVTTAVTAGLSYKEAQSLASVVQAEGMLLRWRARHDLAQQLISVAWFGPSGAPTGSLGNLPAPTTTPIPATLIAEATREFGYEVSDAP